MNRTYQNLVFGLIALCLLIPIVGCAKPEPPMNTEAVAAKQDSIQKKKLAFTGKDIE